MDGLSILRPRRISICEDSYESYEKKKTHRDTGFVFRLDLIEKLVLSCRGGKRVELLNDAVYVISK